MAQIEPHPPIYWPDIPAEPENGWSADARRAFELLDDFVSHAVHLLQQEDPDPTQLAHYTGALESHALPLLETLDQSVEAIPQSWLHACATYLGRLSAALQATSDDAGHREQEAVVVPQAVYVVRTGLRGRPRKEVNVELLREAMAANRNISQTQLARCLGIDRLTLRKLMKKHNITRDFAKLTNDELDFVLKSFKRSRPQSGVRYAVGFLRHHHLRVQRERVEGSLRRIDGIGVFLRAQAKIRRRRYYNKRPNAVWHVDGHHKLVRWGFVIHGFVDGHDRVITAMRATTNNMPSTVLRLFDDGVKEYGMPSRVRGDRGGENIDLAVYMVMRNGPNRGSFLWGTSTHNTRIERIWVEVGTQFARSWRAFFTRLERLHSLDHDNPTHLWLIHFLFLDDINADCERFRGDWNSHPMSGADSGSQSPNDLRLLGQLKFGVYSNNSPPEIHAETIADFQSSEHAGAGPQDSVDAGTILDFVEDAQRSNVRHDGAPVPRHASPFDHEANLERFCNLLDQVRETDAEPNGFGCEQLYLPDYPLTESLIFGRGGRKEIEITLSPDIWIPRARLWCQAACLLHMYI